MLPPTVSEIDLFAKPFFSESEQVWSAGVHVGWGGTCSMHSNADNDRECKISITGTENLNRWRVMEIRVWNFLHTPLLVRKLF